MIVVCFVQIIMYDLFAVGQNENNEKITFGKSENSWSNSSLISCLVLISPDSVIPLYICVYVFMCICVYLYMYVCMYVCMCVCMYIYISIYICIYTYRLYVHTNTYIHIYTYTYEHIYIYFSIVHTLDWPQDQHLVPFFLNIYIYMNIYTYMYEHIYIHTYIHKYTYPLLATGPTCFFISYINGRKVSIINPIKVWFTCMYMCTYVYI
jgi:hypothetical protein